VAAGGGMNVTDGSTSNVVMSASYPTNAGSDWGWAAAGRGTRASAANIGTVSVICLTLTN
jgi:hypothetical protein